MTEGRVGKAKPLCRVKNGKKQFCFLPHDTHSTTLFSFPLDTFYSSHLRHKVQWCAGRDERLALDALLELLHQPTEVRMHPAVKVARLDRLGLLGIPNQRAWRRAATFVSLSRTMFTPSP